MPENSPLISIIIPCRNEQQYIKGILDDIIHQDIDQANIEVIIADGMSEDGTRNIILEYTKIHSHFILIDNVHRTVPYALNESIKHARGQVIIRMDAHSKYPANYISRLNECLNILDADNVGGVWDTQPGDNSSMALAIAVGSSHRIGIGNAHYKTGVSNIKQVDTVPYGCYKREVFDKIGLFDVELTRNQDDEFNGRLTKNGGKIFLIPDVVIKYYARKTLQKLGVTYYQYGYYKPLVNLKLGKPATWRQLAPPGMLFIFSLLLILGYYSHLGAIVFVLFLSFYMLSIFLGAIHASIADRKSHLVFHIMLVFITLHFSYGIGYLKGLIDFNILSRKPAHTNLSR